jgi:hypothetical protein
VQRQTRDQMTRPIHSVKHIQTSYRKYQSIAMSSAILTIIAVILATLSALQLGNLGKQRAAAAQQNRNASVSMNEELTKLKSQIATLETQLSEEHSLKEELEKKNKTLQKKLAEAQQTLAAKSAAPPQPSGLPPETVQPPAPKQIEIPPTDVSQPKGNRLDPQSNDMSIRGEDSNSSLQQPPSTPNQSEAVRTPGASATQITATPSLQNSTSSQPTAQEGGAQPLQNDSSSKTPDTEKPEPSIVKSPAESSQTQ